MTTTRVGGTPTRFRTFRPRTFEYQDSTNAVLHYKYNEQAFPVIDYGEAGVDQSLGFANVTLGNAGAPGLGTSMGIISGRGLTFGTFAQEVVIAENESLAINIITKIESGIVDINNTMSTTLIGAVGGTAAILLIYQYNGQYINLQISDDSSSKLFVDFENVIREINFEKWIQIIVLCDKSSSGLPRLLINGVEFSGRLNPDSTVSLFSDLGTITFPIGTISFNGNVIGPSVTPMYLAEAWLSKGLSYKSRF